MAWAHRPRQGGDGHAPERRGRAGLGGGEGRVLPEDAPFQLGELRARAQPQLIDQGGRGPALGGEGLRLAPVPVEGGRQLDLQPLPQRVGGGEGSERRDQVGVATECELGVEQPLPGGQAQLVEPRGLLPGPGEVGELLVGAAPPLGDRGQQRPLDVGGRAGGGGHRPLEPGHVERIGAQGEQVPAGCRRQGGRTPRQDVAQLGDVGAQRRDGPPAGVVLPQVVGEPVRGDHRPVPHRQAGHQGAPPEARDDDLGAADADRQRPEYPHPGRGPCRTCPLRRPRGRARRPHSAAPYPPATLRGREPCPRSSPRAPGGCLPVGTVPGHGRPPCPGRGTVAAAGRGRARRPRRRCDDPRRRRPARPGRGPGGRGRGRRGRRPRVAEAGDPAAVPPGADGHPGAGPVRVRRQDPAQVRLRGCRGAGRAGGVGALGLRSSTEGPSSCRAT